MQQTDVYLTKYGIVLIGETSDKYDTYLTVAGPMGAIAFDPEKWTGTDALDRYLDLCDEANRLYAAADEDEKESTLDRLFAIMGATHKPEFERFCTGDIPEEDVRIKVVCRKE